MSKEPKLGVLGGKENFEAIALLGMQIAAWYAYAYERLRTGDGNGGPRARLRR